jgi:hypothetical protein
MRSAAVPVAFAEGDQGCSFHLHHYSCAEAM